MVLLGIQAHIAQGKPAYTEVNYQDTTYSSQSSKNALACAPANWQVQGWHYPKGPDQLLQTQ